MTTLAYCSNILAADTKVSGSDNSQWCSIRKIKKVEGYLIGGCGDIDIVQWFLNKFEPKWIDEKFHPALPSGVQMRDDNFEGLIITPKKKIYSVTGKLFRVPIKISKYIAMGSGERVALGAMAVGANAIEAVKAAMKHDACTGGRIQYVRL